LQAAKLEAYSAIKYLLFQISLTFIELASTTLRSGKKRFQAFSDEQHRLLKDRAQGAKAEVRR
jgi:hypothetical protein